MMEWSRLLSAHRFDETSAEPFSPARSPFHKDLDRIVFSSAFRRLQDKTQVHSLPESDYVRTRLTHSMEVASVGRSLGATVGHHVTTKYAMPAGLTGAEFGHIVAAACLAHDIGNPPFGHFGEATIRGWFENDPVGRQLIDDLTAQQRHDFLRFEGNAQGFRILTRLQNWRDAGGLRLTYATLATYTKYPRASRLADETAAAADCGGRKFGFFAAEQTMFEDVAERVGLIRRAPGTAYWCRHPLAFLVEAADDICYQIVDLEDGYKLDRIRFAEAEALLMALAGDALSRYREIDEEPRRIAYLRAKAIGRLVDLTGEVFLDNLEAILAGRFTAELLGETPSAPVLREIAELTEKRVFQTRERYENELDGGRAIEGLLGAYCAKLTEDKALAADAEARYRRLLEITDYVSGMTDSFTIQQHRKLHARRED